MKVFSVLFFFIALFVFPICFLIGAIGNLILLKKRRLTSFLK
jgi:hypothetical protein